MIGKNLNPWNEPQVARYRPLAAECGEMMKSELVVKASLRGVNVRSVCVCGLVCNLLRMTYQHMRCFLISQLALLSPYHRSRCVAMSCFSASETFHCE